MEMDEGIKIVHIVIRISGQRKKDKPHETWTKPANHASIWLGIYLLNAPFELPSAFCNYLLDFSVEIIHASQVCMGSCIEYNFGPYMESFYRLTNRKTEYVFFLSMSFYELDQLKSVNRFIEH